MTNSRKAAVIALVNAAMGLAIAFGLSLTDVQQAAITTFVNTALLAWVAFTYKDSPNRAPDAEGF